MGGKTWVGVVAWGEQRQGSEDMQRQRDQRLRKYCTAGGKSAASRNK